MHMHCYPLVEGAHFHRGLTLQRRWMEISCELRRKTSVCEEEEEGLSCSAAVERSRIQSDAGSVFAPIAPQ